MNGKKAATPTWYTQANYDPAGFSADSRRISIIKRAVLKSFQMLNDLTSVIRVDVKEKISVATILPQLLLARRSCPNGDVVFICIHNLDNFLLIAYSKSFVSAGKQTRLRTPIIHHTLQIFEVLHGNIVRVTCPTHSCNEKWEEWPVFSSGLVKSFVPWIAD